MLGPFLSLLLVLAADGAPRNLISNPGFEVRDAAGKLPADWAVVGGTSAGRGMPDLMSDGGHTGGRYLRMVDDGPESSLFFATRRVPAWPAGDYAASAWMRTTDRGRPGIYINLYNDQGGRIHHVYARADGPTKGWVQVDVAATAPTTAAFVTVSLYSFRGDRGTFDFDDVELHVKGGREPFQGIGRLIRAGSSLPISIPCGYMNVSHGYITDGPNTGDREYMSAFYRYTKFRPPLEKPAGDVLADQAIRILSRFCKGAD